MTTKCLPRGFGGYGGKQSSGSCKQTSKCRPVACFAIDRSCANRETCKVPRSHHQLERILKDCKFVFTDGETNACCDCGDLVSLLGDGCIGVRVDDKCTVYIDGIELRKKIRAATCNIPPIPTSDDPNDYIIWKSLVDDFIGVADCFCCADVCAAVTYFAEVLQSKINGCEEGDVWCTFAESGNELLDLLEEGGVYNYIVNVIGCSDDWERVGQTIEGESTNDQSGTSVSMNAVGDRMIVGEPFHNSQIGRSRVFEFNGESMMWVQLGNDIEGESTSQSGKSVSMNALGDRVIIGGPVATPNGFFSGQSRVFEYNSTSELWVQVGQTIEGNSSFVQNGAGVSINAIGDRVIVGEPGAQPNGINSGRSRVFEFDGGSMMWVPVGNPIDGDIAGDFSGFSVSMNDVGDRVIVGEPSAQPNGFSSGRSRVFEFDGVMTWVQVGNDIDGENAIDQSGFSVSINALGDRVIVGDHLFDCDDADDCGRSRVFEFDGVMTWVQIGNDIEGENENDSNGTSVSINAEGDRVIVGEPGSGRSRVFRFDETSIMWVLIGNPIGGESGTSVSMNDVGNRVVTGAPFAAPNGNNSGQSRVFKINDCLIS